MFDNGKSRYLDVLKISRINDREVYDFLFWYFVRVRVWVIKRIFRS